MIDNYSSLFYINTSVTPSKLSEIQHDSILRRHDGFLTSKVLNIDNGKW